MFVLFSLICVRPAYCYRFSSEILVLLTMAMSLRNGFRLASQTLRMTAGRTYSSALALKSSPLCSSVPDKSSFLTPRRLFSNSSSNNFPRQSTRNSPDDDSNNGHRKEILLMDFRVVPSLLTRVIGIPYNRIFERYIVHKYDKDFSFKSFEQEAKGALVAVSDILASDDISSLIENGLVDEAAFQEIKVNHDKMNCFQRRKLRVSEDQVFNIRIHEAYVVKDKDTGSEAIEILVVFGVRSDRMIMICNYRFYKDFTNANDPSPWIINTVSHFDLKFWQLKKSLWKVSDSRGGGGGGGGRR